MKRTMGFPISQALSLGAVLLWGIAVFGQGPDTYLITPNKTTMLIGESRVFRMVDQNGRAQHKVTWTISDADAFQSIEGDELELIAKQAGDFRLTARTDFAIAEGTIRVMGGSTLPVGTVKWSSGAMKGCTATKIIPAMPRPNGPDIFVQSLCPDGAYIAAYTTDGIMLWRRRMSDSGTPAGAGANNYGDFGNRLEPRSASICDSVSVGADQQKIRDLLAQQNLSFQKEPGGSGAWLVEESNTQCRMWFDEKSVLVKKRKVFIVGDGSSLSGSIEMPAVQHPQTDEKKAPVVTQTTDGAAPVPTAVAPAKPTDKPKKVTTNDDIQSSPFAGFGGVFYTSTGSINDCDANCFDQVRSLSQVDTEKNPNWRRDVLAQIEIVRSDSEWQAYLHELYDAHNKVCQLTFDKQDELRKSGNWRNMGPQEIAIAEKYEVKMKAAQADLAATVARQSTLQKKFAGKPYANSFATVQGTRMQGGFCSQARVIYAK